VKPAITILSALAMGAMAAAPALQGQQSNTRVRISVADFDYGSVRQSVSDVFGGDADVGKALADLVSQQLAQDGRYDVAARSSLAEEGRSDPTVVGRLAVGGIDVVLAGSVTAYGKQTGQGPGVNVHVGRVGLGRFGKQQTVAYVVLSVQLVGPAGVLPLGPIVGEADASGSGTSLTGDLNVAGLSAGGTLDLSGKEYAKTTIGQATIKAVKSVSNQIGTAYDQVHGALVPVAPPVAPPVQPVPLAPAAPLPAAYGAPITGPFTWGIYQFKGTEHFKYDAHMTDDGEKQDGWYTIDAKPAGNGMYQLAVAGELGTDSFRSTTTVAPGQGVPMMQLAAMGPGAMLLFSPVYMMFGGQQWQVGNEWSFNHEGDNASFKVESTCSYAGVSGLRGVWRKNDAVMMDMCVSPNVALPLAMVTADEDGTSTQQMTLVEFHP
jgi:curli biogenesis system outer membrane secretion channel CsgG